MVEKWSRETMRIRAVADVIANSDEIFPSRFVPHSAELVLHRTTRSISFKCYFRQIILRHMASVLLVVISKSPIRA